MKTTSRFEANKANWAINFSKLKSESLVAHYESVRRQVHAAKQDGGRNRFVGESARQYADALAKEMERRQIQFEPINWFLKSAGLPGAFSKSLQKQV